jgi:hypothetical protein
MSASSKQIYIPSISIKGYYVEEVGAEKDRVVYPGGFFDVNLDIEDFENTEDYHAAWIALTRAVKNKLIKNAKGSSS